MKKILLIFVFFLSFIEGVAQKNDDYTLFLNGKDAYYKRNFEVAKLNFETLLKSFSRSDIFRNNYPYFYIGMTYYHLGDYESAAFFLEKAVYLSKTFPGEDSKIQDIHFLAERDFALGDSLLKIGKEDKAITYLQRIDYDNFYPFVAYYEKKALELLSDFSSKDKDKLKIKFNYDFTSIDRFSTEELLKIGNFFNSKKEFSKEEELYTLMLKKDSLSLEERKKITAAYLKSLLESNSKEKIIKFTSTPNKNFKDLYSFYRGLAFYQYRDFSRALYIFSTIKEEEYFSKANYYIASIYFSLGDYNNSLIALNKIEKKDMITDSMAAFSYYSLGDEKNLEKAIKVLSKKYPNTYLGIYFKTLDPTYKEISFNSLANLVDFSNRIFNSFQTSPNSFLQSGDILEIEQLSRISALKDRNLLKLALEKSVFWGKTTREAALAITTILENGDFYELAFKNSINNMGNFIDYENLLKYSFPLYYQDKIEKVAKFYDVPLEIIYTLIHDLSEFNPYYISEDSKFGLMCIPYSEVADNNFFELFDIDKNIELGVKRLHTLLEKYNGNKIKTLVAYVYGEDYLKELYFDYTNDINLATILDPQRRFFLQNLLMTYVLYSRLYQFNN